MKSLGVLPLLLAAAVTAAPLDATHAAVLAVLRMDADSGACDSVPLREMAAKAEITPLGRAGADRIVLALVTNPCICGAQNCPYFAIRIGSGSPRTLFSAYGIDAHMRARAGTLPDVMIAAHDSAAVIDETTYGFRDGTYAVVKSERVRVGDGARKPNTVPVHFAAGASSAELRGRVGLGWYDDYTFAATGGQQLTLTTAAHVTLTLLGPKDGDARPLRANGSFRLPRAGTYQLLVEGASDDDVAYVLTLAIR